MSKSNRAQLIDKLLLLCLISVVSGVFGGVVVNVSSYLSDESMGALFPTAIGLFSAILLFFGIIYVCFWRNIKTRDYS